MPATPLVPTVSRSRLFAAPLALGLLWLFGANPAILSGQTTPLSPVTAAAAPDVDSPTAPTQPKQAEAKAQKAAPSGTQVGWLELSGPLAEAPQPFAWVDSSSGKPTLRGVVEQLNTVARDPDFLGVVLYLEQPMLNMAHAFEIGQAMGHVREAGKKVLVFAEQYDTLSYLLASEADEILLQKNGQMFLPGLGVEEMYVAEMLGHIGAEADFIQVGKYKGAAEALTRTGPSEAWDQNFDALLDDLYQQIVGRIAERRGMSVKRLEKLMKASLTLTDEELKESGLVDRLVTRNVTEVAEDLYGKPFAWNDAMGQRSRSLKADNPFALFQMLFNPPQRRSIKPQLAIIYAEGPITSGESQIEGGFSGNTIGSQTITRALGRAADDDQIKGVLLRLDSPGGSALASEVIWQAVHETSEQKPVFVSLGRAAASGGYYIASAADEIYATPGSLVGSIGVVGGKIVLGGTYDKLGISIHRRTRGPRGDVFNSVETFTPEQRKMLRKMFQQTYDMFIERVTTGRGDRLADVDQVAEGRIFTGHQGVENGMIDELGGMQHALAGLAEAVGLEPGTYGTTRLPEPMSFPEFLEQALGGAAAAPNQIQGPAAARITGITAAAREALGPRRYQAAAGVLDGLLLLRREPVLTLMPTAISID